MRNAVRRRRDHAARSTYGCRDARDQVDRVDPPLIARVGSIGGTSSRPARQGHMPDKRHGRDAFADRARQDRHAPTFGGQRRDQQGGQNLIAESSAPSSVRKSDERLPPPSRIRSASRHASDDCRLLPLLFVLLAERRPHSRPTRSQQQHRPRPAPRKTSAPATHTPPAAPRTRSTIATTRPAAKMAMIAV